MKKLKKKTTKRKLVRKRKKYFEFIKNPLLLNLNEFEKYLQKISEEKEKVIINLYSHRDSNSQTFGIIYKKLGGTIIRGTFYESYRFLFNPLNQYLYDDKYNEKRIKSKGSDLNFYNEEESVNILNILFETDELQPTFQFLFRIEDILAIDDENNQIYFFDTVKFNSISIN